MICDRQSDGQTDRWTHGENNVSRPFGGGGGGRHNSKHETRMLVSHRLVWFGETLMGFL